MKKFSRIIKPDTIKALLSRSGNRCAFPECTHPLFNEENLFVAQLCHIEAVSPGGPRYNPGVTNEQINSYDNLLFLCYRHHKESDDESKYNLDQLKLIKKNHETRFLEQTFSVTSDLVAQVVKDSTAYWNSVDYINAVEHVMPDFKIEVDAFADEGQIVAEIKELHYNLERLFRILPSELATDYFEVICLGVPNSLSRLNLLIEQLQLKILELKLLNDPRNSALAEEVKQQRERFADLVKHSTLAD